MDSVRRGPYLAGTLARLTSTVPSVPATGNTRMIGRILGSEDSDQLADASISP